MNTRSRNCSLVVIAAGALLMLGVAAPGMAQDQPPPTPPTSPPASPPASSPPSAPARGVTPAPATPPEKDGEGSRPRDEADNPGIEIVVYLKDGKSMTGMLVRETREDLYVRISGIETPIPTSTIDRYQILEPVVERYRRYRASIGEEPDQIALLVSWLQAREQYDLALDECERLLKIDPHHKQGLALQKAVRSQKELRDAARNRKVVPAAERPVVQPERGEAAAREPFPLLSEAQINLIKVFEIDMDDPPRIIITRATVTKLLEAYAGSPLLPATPEGRDAIYRKPALEVLDLMFRLRARELYGEIQVLDHPRSMRLFRDEVQAAWLINSCATTACHGGTDAGRLMLVNRKPRSEASLYTNFIIMERFRLDDGTPLLNYDDPARSPLLQMALPRHESMRAHPEVPNGPRGNDVWRPLFRNQQERGFERTVAWLKSMYRPRPEYPIEYRPPRASEAAEKAKGEPSPR